MEGAVLLSPSFLSHVHGRMRPADVATPSSSKSCPELPHVYFDGTRLLVPRHPALWQWGEPICESEDTAYFYVIRLLLFPRLGTWNSPLDRVYLLPHLHQFAHAGRRRERKGAARSEASQSPPTISLLLLVGYGPVQVHFRVAFIPTSAAMAFFFPP